MEQLRVHLGYVSILLGKWLAAGPQIWDATRNASYPSSVDIGDRRWGGEELSNYCIALKRRGDYAEAIGGYLQLVAASLSEYGKIPVFLMRGLWKVLICANAFSDAFALAGTILADLQNSPSAAPEEIMCADDYWKGLARLSMQVIDNNDYSQVQAYCANFSGNPYYTLVQSRSEIHAEMAAVREKLRNVYRV